MVDRPAMPPDDYDDNGNARINENESFAHLTLAHARTHTHMTTMKVVAGGGGGGGVCFIQWISIICTRFVHMILFYLITALVCYCCCRC